MNIVLVTKGTPESRRLERELARASFGPHQVRHFQSIPEALTHLEHLGTHAIVVELETDPRNPLSDLEQIRAQDADMPVIALIDRAERPLALEALRLGAQEVLGMEGLSGESLFRAARHALERSILSRELREREEQYHRIVESAEEGIWTIDAHDRTTFVNRKMTQLLGYSLEEMLGKSPLDFMDAESQSIAIPRLAAKRKGEILRMDMRYLRKDGSSIWTSLSTNPTYDHQGRYQGAMALVSDISDRKQKEEVLHRMAALVESSVDSIITVDLEGTVLSWNRAAEMLYGYSAAEAIGRSIRFVVPPDRQLEVDEIFRRIRKGVGTPTFETVRKHQDGRLIAVSVGVSPVRNTEGKLIAASAIIRDMSAQQRLQEQFRQAQKMEAVGRLAGGVAHDFNNLLTVICGYTSLLMTRKDCPESMKEELSEIGKAGDRAASLTRQLLAFSRKQVTNAQVINLNPMIKDLEKMLRRLIGEDIQLSTILEEDLGRVKVDLGQMEQVIMNLAVNARDAMPEGGRMIIETRNRTLDEDYIGSQSGPPSGSYVVLSVSDTGVGMSKETQSRLFEPFFTTKGLGKGTGLGLSTIYGIVRQGGGHITVYSELGKGSCFRIYLPSTTAAPSSPLATSAAPESLEGSESIMVVEDNETIRQLTCEVLSQKGYRVRSYGSAEEALHAAATEGFPDLLLTDMVLPVMNGLALCRAAAQEKWGIKRLLMTGYTEEAILHQGVSECGIPLLHKPFSPAALLTSVRGALGEPAAKPSTRLRPCPPLPAESDRRQVITKGAAAGVGPSGRIPGDAK